MINPEYLRRNLMVARAAGARANASAALKRLEQQTRPAKWLVKALQGIVERTSGLDGELACYRSAVPEQLPTPCDLT